jgi:hypothetical protein
MSASCLERWPCRSLVATVSASEVSHAISIVYVPFGAIIGLGGCVCWDGLLVIAAKESAMLGRRLRE